MNSVSLSQGENPQVREGVGAAGVAVAGGGVLERTPGPEDPCWDVEWLAELREVPEDATWPRYMTLPHPRAVGSYGDELCAVFAELNGRPPRWWQRLAFARIGEHDEDGLLCWPEYLGTTSRQVGKSWALRALAVWRLRKADLWGEQLVLHTGRGKDVVLEVARPAMAWAERHGLIVSRNNGREGITTGKTMDTGSRWLLRAKDAVYGLSPGNALVDEGWDVPGRYVDEGIEPTLVEQVSPQLGLWSTAHRRATGLMLDRRTLALQQLMAPHDVLLLEWSTPASVARDDPAGWRMASPSWSATRERLVSRAYRKVLAGESVDPEEPDPVASFDAQWLNRWPGAAAVRQDELEEPLVDPAAWRACRDDAAQPPAVSPIFLTLESDLGRGTAVAAAGVLDDGRVAVGGHYFEARAAAVEWLAGVADGYVDAVLLVGASMINDPDVADLDVAVEPIGAAETRAALPLLRELVRDRLMAYDGTQAALVAEVEGCRVRPGVGSAIMLLTGHERTALLRCAAWATRAAHQDRE